MAKKTSTLDEQDHGSPDVEIVDPDEEAKADNPGARRRKISYGLEDDAIAKTPWPQSAENPHSSNFEPLSLRGDRGKARWWARFARKVRGRMTTEY